VVKYLASLLLLCAACGPVPVHLAEQQCLESAQLAQRPQGSFGIVADNHGNVGTTLSIGISSDYLRGRDPDAVYASCVQNKSGFLPSQPFSSQPDAHIWP